MRVVVFLSHSGILYYQSLSLRNSLIPAAQKFRQAFLTFFLKYGSCQINKHQGLHFVQGMRPLLLSTSSIPWCISGYRTKDETCLLPDDSLKGSFRHSSCLHGACNSISQVLTVWMCTPAGVRASRFHVFTSMRSHRI